ncbi:hypothetical protein BDV3_000257 [Batrachochytrium dendrobatidis]|nr:hypothetical protein O5D80_004545 [Batrachochytrium dendrobatidis]KAK5667963.1 hypothetical protein QVD99_005011 [Batrachochytrium dendrobatidis]OAJ37226.1 hypothetical protein BDEG_21274 [Batrachochytrium dendrobatidis JEL423]
MDASIHTPMSAAMHIEADSYTDQITKPSQTSPEIRAEASTFLQDPPQSQPSHSTLPLADSLTQHVLMAHTTQYKPTVSNKADLSNPIAIAKWKELEEIFHVFDTDGSGTIEPAEMRILMWTLGLESEIVNLDSMIANQLSVSREKAAKVSLSLHQFIDLMTQQMKPQDTPENFINAFRLFDPEGKGQIGVKELRQASRDINEPMTDEDILLIVNRLDKDGDGEIGIEDWMVAMANGHGLLSKSSDVK